MRVVGTPGELRSLLNSHRNQEKNIGLVPTMGALHDGHFKLIESCKSQNEISVVSIFVNPLQFDKDEDLRNYPRDLDSDLDQLALRGVDYVFAPTDEGMYPSQPAISIDLGSMSNSMEGKFRKGHFEGVSIVVLKLLNIVQPTTAYFGMKDLQQFLIVKRMCEDLNVSSQVIGVETIRESSGLAMSSRNRRLSENGRQIAANIYEGLSRFGEGIKKEENLKDLHSAVQSYYDSISDLEMEYVEVVNAANLEAIDSYDEINELAVCVAGYVEGIRLIDNLYLRLK